MQSLHDHLMENSPLYKGWHNKKPLSHMAHWGVFVLVALSLTYTAINGIDIASRQELASVAGFAAAPASVQYKASQPIPGAYIVTFASDVSDIPGQAKQIANQYGGSLGFTYTKAIKGFSISNLPPQTADALKRNPKVQSVEQDATVYAASTEDLKSVEQTLGLSTMWALDRIDQRNKTEDYYYNYNSAGAGVNVYVLDTGISTTHQEFGGRALGAYTAINDGKGTSDCNGHGTMVSSVAGGTNVGVAKDSILYAVRVLDCSGSGTWSQVIAGIDWIIQNRKLPAVANMSMAGSQSSTLNSAVQNLIKSGVAVSVAAGNSGADACNYSPASTPEAMTVGSIWNADSISSFSNYGKCLDIFAPGEAVAAAYVAGDNQYIYAGGTSLAAPFVAGVAALYLSAHPSATPAEVAQAIVSTATTGVISGVPSGTPNLLLYSLFDGTVTPPPPSGDTTAPSVPANLSGTATDSTHIALSWSASTDDVGVTGYKVYRNGSQLTTTTNTSYADSSVSAGTAYTYSVAAYDAAGNTSAQSSPITVTTPSATPAPVPAFSVGDSVYTTSRVNVRSTPAAKGKPLGKQNAGATGVILDGPQQGSGYTWWYVDFDSGADGWVVQDYLGK